MCLNAGSTWSLRWTGVVRDAKRSVLLSLEMTWKLLKEWKLKR